MALPGSGTLTISMINGELVRTPTNQVSSLQALANLAKDGSTPKVNAATPCISHWYNYVNGDTIAPTNVTNLIPSNFTSSSVTLNWTEATDNVAVTGYKIYMTGGSGYMATVTGTTYTPSGLSSNTTFTFTVKSIDAAGNESSGTSVTIKTNVASSTGTITNTTGYTIAANQMIVKVNNVQVASVYMPNLATGNQFTFPTTYLTPLSAVNFEVGFYGTFNISTSNQVQFAAGNPTAFAYLGIDGTGFKRAIYSAGNQYVINIIIK